MFNRLLFLYDKNVDNIEVMSIILEWNNYLLFVIV